jgi:hypothetical protein
MPRRSSDDDRSEGDDEPRQPAKKGGLGGVALGVIIGGVVVLLVVVVGCVGALYFGRLGFQKVAQEQAQQEAQVARALLTREAFEAKTVGKTKAEIIGLLGKPHRMDRAPGGEYWMYERQTVDAATGKPDTDATLWFDEAGKVTRVTY